METIAYPMTKDYRKEWGVIDAVRELVQNCLDNKEQPSEYVTGIDGSIIIHTQNYLMPMSMFALGESQKANNSIGGFGEGFKLALMILAREGSDIYMLNGTKIFTPTFVHNEQLGIDTFAITIEDNLSENDGLINNCGLSFIFDIDIDLMDELKEKINVFSNNILPLPNTVDMLEEHPGKIYINGLFVCEEDKFKYGYNFAPSKLRLGCDRQIANAFGMAWETSEVWADKLCKSNADEVLQMMTESVLDVADIHYHLSERKAKLITEAFVERFGNVTIKPMGSGLSYGMSVGGSVYRSMEKSGYTKVAKQWAEPNTPFSELETFIRRHGKKVRREFKVKFDTILEQSKRWELK